MQAEHIPVHLGAMPAAVAAVLGEDHSPGRRLDPQRPVPRRHAPARHHADLAAVPRAASYRLRSQSRASRGRGRARAGQHAGRLAHARGRGRGDPAYRARRRVLRDLASRMRNPRQRGADLRAQLAAGRAGARAGRELVERYGLATLAPGWPRPSTTPSAAPAPRIAELEDGTRRRATCSRLPRATSSCGCARRSRVTSWSSTSRLRGPARRQPQLPPGRDRVRLRTSRCVCSRTPMCQPAPGPTGRSPWLRRRARC